MVVDPFLFFMFFPVVLLLLFFSLRGVVVWLLCCTILRGMSRFSESQYLGPPVERGQNKLVPDCFSGLSILVGEPPNQERGEKGTTEGPRY